jgi:Zn-dependent protease
MNLMTALFLLPGLVIGLTFHEAAHAITAKWLGDRTSERMGRISLNPFRHLSPLGTLVLFFIGFGWGRPVIVNLYNFKKPKLYYLLSSLAGPAANLILCGISLGLLHLYLHWSIQWICTSVFFINAILACVNLLPIPPLDGSKIWPCIIPGARPVISGKWTMVWMAVLVVSLYSGVINKILGPVLGFLASLLPKM